MGLIIWSIITDRALDRMDFFAEGLWDDMTNMRNILKCMAFAAAAITLSGCGAKTSYMGVNFNNASALPSTQPSTPILFSDHMQQLLNERAGTSVTLQSLDGLALGSLAQRASAGDKYAQLELGIRFQEGRGVTRDIKKARKLYTKAASDSGGRIWVYSPPVGSSPGRTIPLDTGPKIYGLPEAIRRLEALEEVE